MAVLHYIVLYFSLFNIIDILWSIPIFSFRFVLLELKISLLSGTSHHLFYLLDVFNCDLGFYTLRFSPFLRYRLVWSVHRLL